MAIKSVFYDMDIARHHDGEAVAGGALIDRNYPLASLRNSAEAVESYIDAGGHHEGDHVIIEGTYDDAVAHNGFVWVSMVGVVKTKTTRSA